MAKTANQTSKFENRKMCKARSCATCHWHWCPRGWHKDWKEETDQSFCMLDIPQEDIDYVVDQLENKTGYDPESYTRRLIQIMGLNEEKPKLLDFKNPRWLQYNEERTACQYYKKSKSCIYR